MLHFDFLAYVAIFRTEIHEKVILLKTTSIPNQLLTKIFSQNSFLTLKMAKINLSERQNWTQNLDFRNNILTFKLKCIFKLAFPIPKNNAQTSEQLQNLQNFRKRVFGPHK